MIPLIEPVLYIDPQAQKADTFCQICGSLLYAPSFICIRCGRESK